MKKFFLFIFLILFNFLISLSQEDTIKIDYNNFTRDDIMDMDYNDMMDIDFEILLMLSQKMEMSLAEFQKMLLNPSQYISSKKKEESFTSPLSISVISSKEITESGATCIPEILRLSPGIIVREKTNGNYDVHIRGLDNIPMEQTLASSINTKTLVMIDGRLVYNYFQGGTLWNALPIGVFDIERIEIIRGASSALYGSNAVTGVINIITKKSNSKKLKLNVNFQNGNTNANILNISMGKKFGKKFGARLSGNFQNADRFQTDYFCFAEEHEVPLDSLIIHGVPNYVIGTDSFPKHYQRVKNTLYSIFPDVNYSKQQTGSNAFLYYNFNKNIKLDLSFGIQHAKWQSIYIENNVTPYSFNESRTDYFDFKMKLWDFNFKINRIKGYYDVYKGYDGYKYDIDAFTYDIDYNFNKGNFFLYSGLNFQSSFYDDKKYTKNIKRRSGFLNGKHEIKIAALTLRADYKFLDDKLRFVLGMRAETYNKFNVDYFSFGLKKMIDDYKEIIEDALPSWQFASSYEIDKNNFIHFSISTANQSPFMFDTYSNFFTSEIESFLIDESENILIIPFEIYINGNNDLELLKTTNYEIGFRNKLRSNIYTDIEFFYSKTDNFSIPIIDTAFIDIRSEEITKDTVFVIKKKFKNVQLESHQFGVSGSVNIVFSKKFTLKLFSSFQNTFLTGVNPITLFEYSQEIYEDLEEEELLTKENNSTPSYYGGFNLSFYPTKKIYINLNTYFYGNQNFSYKSSDEMNLFDYDINEKIIFNLKIDYKFYKNHSIFFNARNLFGDSRREFPFADRNKGTYLLGLNLNF